MKIFIFKILDFISKNFIDVLLISLIFFVILIFKIAYNLDIKESLLMMDDTEQHPKSAEFDESRHFCAEFEGDSTVLEEKCGLLNDNICKTTECCVLANFKGDNKEKKCVAGSKTGPTYLSDDKNNIRDDLVEILD